MKLPRLRTSPGAEIGDSAPADLAARSAVARQERERLARDLHDSVKQQLFTLRMSTAAAEARWETDPDGARVALGEARAASERAMVEMEALLRQLRPDPLAGTSLVDALREQCEALRYRSGAEVELELGDLPADDELPTAVPPTLFRIAQEALNNVARHARARRVTVALGRRQSGLRSWLELVVADDGGGFQPGAARRGLGLASMDARAGEAGGRLRLAAAPGGGCRLEVRLPVPAPGPPPVPWTTDAEWLGALLTAATTAASLLLVAIALGSRVASAAEWVRHTPTALLGLGGLADGAALLLLGAWLRLRRLERRLDPEHPERLRWKVGWHLVLAWLGVLTVAATAVQRAWWVVAAAAVVLAADQVRRALSVDRALRRRLPRAALAVEIARERRRHLWLLGSGVLALLAATVTHPDALFAVPLLALGGFFVHRWRRLRGLHRALAAGGGAAA
ncbi:MAG TPA: sensor histidine kinase [Thermoanaerobaculia bacterium]|nr:sensor histidine kinase [Thermoanaerobaculia bacterium]